MRLLRGPDGAVASAPSGKHQSVSALQDFQFPKKTVAFIIGSRSEEQRIGRRIESGRAITEGKPPQPVDNYRTVAAVKFSGALSAQVERVDVTVPKIANQQFAAETAEITGRQGHSPRCVERAARSETPQR